MQVLTVKNLYPPGRFALPAAKKWPPVSEQCSLGLDDDVRDKMTKLPYFFGGQSLGGALSLLMALRVRGDSSRSDMASRFMGTMLNCPAIKGAIRRGRGCLVHEDGANCFRCLMYYCYVLFQMPDVLLLGTYGLSSIR